MTYKAKGTLTFIGAEQNISDKFTKREFVIKIEDGKYPQLVKFELTNDKTGLIDSYGLGVEIYVSFKLKGREWTKDGKTAYFNTLEAYNVDVAVNAGKDDPKPIENQHDLPDTDDLLPF